MRIDMPTCQYGEDHCRKHFDGNCFLKQDLLDERCPIRRTINDILKIVDRVRLEIDGEPEDEEVERIWNAACDMMEKYVLGLKGGDGR